MAMPLGEAGEEFIRMTIDADDQRRALGVSCPSCSAPAGSKCRTLLSGEAMARSHPSRVEAGR